MFLDRLLSAFSFPKLNKGKGRTLIEVIDTLYFPIDFQILLELSLFEVLGETSDEYLPHLNATTEKGL
jgi:hypothetical protein